MISYQPSFDPFHTIFRMLRLWDVLEVCGDVEYDKFRILDFYLCFPFRASSIKLQRGHGYLRKISDAHAVDRPYGGLPDDADLFVRMMPIQRLAAETLAARGWLDSDALRQGRVMPGDVEVPAELMERVSSSNSADADLIAMLRVLCGEYVLMGNGGLKQRTGLLEFRYDAV